MSSKPTLYYAPASPPSRAVLMVARDLGLELNHKLIDILGGENRSEEYMKVNPAHSLPTFVDGDLVLSDSHAAITYIVDTYAPGHALYPSDRKIRAQIDRFLYFDCGATFPAEIAIIIQVLFKGLKPTDDQVNMWRDKVAILDKYLDGRKYLVGENRTLADVSNYATITFAVNALALALDEFPNVAAWFEQIKSELPYDQELNVDPLIPVRKRYDQVVAVEA